MRLYVNRLHRLIFRHTYTNRWYVGVTFFSLIVSLVGGRLLGGGWLALPLIMVLQLYLPGLLVARALGKLSAPHPVTRFVWVLSGGMGLTICLGGVARFLQLPIPVYLIVLHTLMFILAVGAPRGEVGEAQGEKSRRPVALYVLLALICLVSGAAGYERSRVRYNGFEDQTVFISLANWLASDPDDPSLLSLQMGRVKTDVRWVTDGWTYTHAAWQWSSGVPAARFIWHDITPLFAWTVPLIFFGLVYEITQRETAATWTAAALVIFALLTADDLVYVQNRAAFGQAALFELDTLRKMSAGVVLPLALFSLLAYLRAPRWRDLLLVSLIGLALALMHPQQTAIFLVAAGATTAVWWLADPGRARLRQAAGPVVVLMVVALLPFLQRQTDPTQMVSTAQWYEQQLLAPEEPDGASPGEASPGEVSPSEADTGASPTQNEGFYVERQSAQGSVRVLVLGNMPLLGTTYIIDPAEVFYHPLVVLAVVVGLAMAVRWRRSLAAQYIVAATAAPLLLLLTPGLAALVVGALTFVVAQQLVLAIPVAVALGVSLDLALDRLMRARTARGVGTWVVAGLLAAVIVVLYLEPFPITGSGRDQLRAASEMESMRAMHPADQALLDSLARDVIPNRRNVVMMASRASSYLIESIPHVLITGGRSSGNRTYWGTARFFTESTPRQPWLDAADLDFIAEVGATHIVMEADDTRLAQMLLRQDWFQVLDTPAGYITFRVLTDGTRTPADDVFARMNELYAQLDAPRWTGETFEMPRAGDPALWEPIRAQWGALLAGNPADDLARLGLAFTYLMQGDDERALPLWQELHERHPQISLVMMALAQTQRHLGDGAAALTTLRAGLTSDSAAVRVLAARALLTDTFFYLVDEALLPQVIDVTAADDLVWSHLADLDHLADLRERAELLMSAGYWDVAARWLDRLPPPEVGPQDLIDQAVSALVQGDVDGALTILRPTTDPDRIASKVLLHPDRWANNTAAQMYFLLLGDVAYREARWADAAAAYQQAVERGARWAGRYFLARTWDAAGQPDRAAALWVDIESEWQALYRSPLPDMEPWLTVADHRALYVMAPEVSQDESAHTLTVQATFGTHAGGYAVREWLLQVANPPATEHYTSVSVPAIFPDGVPVRVSLAALLPDDLPLLTAARVFVEPRYSGGIAYPQYVKDVVLNRPPPVEPPAEAIRAALHFGPDILLHSYTVEITDEALTLTLYWQAARAPQEDFQVLFHVYDENGEIVLQGDSAPVHDTYPTSQWRTDGIIADVHRVRFDEPLPAGEYTIGVGLYRLSDGARLPITPADNRIADNRAMLFLFRR